MMNLIFALAALYSPDALASDISLVNSTPSQAEFPLIQNTAQTSAGPTLRLVIENNLNTELFLRAVSSSCARDEIANMFVVVDRGVVAIHSSRLADACKTREVLIEAFDMAGGQFGTFMVRYESGNLRFFVSSFHGYTIKGNGSEAGGNIEFQISIDRK